MLHFMFTGTYTAIVTPFKNGKIDEAALKRLIDLQIKGGVDGIVPAGIAGELGRRASPSRPGAVR